MAKNVQKTPRFGVLDNLSEPTSTHTHDDTHTHNTVPVVKETKNRRVQILTYDSLVDQMDLYGKQNGMSRAEVFEAAIKEFLENKSI